MQPDTGSAAPSRPTIRLLHHLARSGGTLISRCLGCMDGTVLLSEIHPAGTRHFDPVRQAADWFGLFAADDLAALHGRRLGFAEAVGTIEARTRARGQRLVLRDWTHLDFVGVPFVRQPPYRLKLADALAGRFTLVQTATVRHPVDQWLSTSRLSVMRGQLDFDRFLLGCRLFAEVAVRIGFVRYEDLTADPDGRLRLLCERLRLPFDPGYAERWHAWDKVTGDRGSLVRRAIAPQVAGAGADAALLARFAANPDYRDTLALLGYAHPG